VFVVLVWLVLDFCLMSVTVASGYRAWKHNVRSFFQGSAAYCFRLTRDLVTF